MSVLQQNSCSFALWDFSHFREISREKLPNEKKLAYFSNTIVQKTEILKLVGSVRVN